MMGSFSGLVGWEVMIFSLHFWRAQKFIVWRWVSFITASQAHGVVGILSLDESMRAWFTAMKRQRNIMASGKIPIIASTSISVRSLLQLGEAHLGGNRAQ